MSDHVVNLLNQNITVSILLIVTGAVIAKLASKAIIVAIRNKFEDDNPNELNKIEKRVHTLTSIIKSIINIAIYGMAIVMIMSELGINIAPILTGAGVLGVAVGFGAQSLVKDAVTGFFILLENTYDVGDTVKIAGIEGTILNINLRTTEIKEKNGNISIVPNSQITTISRIYSN